MDNLFRVIWLEANKTFDYEQSYSISLFKILPKEYNLTKFTLFLGAIGFSNLAPSLQSIHAEKEIPRSAESTFLQIVLFFAGLFVIGFGFFYLVPFLEGILDWVNELYGIMALILSLMLSLIVFVGLILLWFSLSYRISLFSLRQKVYLENITRSGTTREIECVKILSKLPVPLRNPIFWKTRPTTMELENALYKLQSIPNFATDVWKMPLEMLTKDKNLAKPKPIDRYLNDLSQADWQIRFVARHMLVHLGGEGVPILDKKLTVDNPWRDNIIWILKNISIETSSQLGSKAPDLLCPRCLTFCHKHKVRLSPFRSVNIYGCRVCYQSKEFLERPAKLIAVLDAGMNERYREIDKVIRGNWLKQKSLFDFNSVEIVDATDEQVERFAVQIGNDTDQIRKKKYKNMDCLVLNCELSENTTRILQRTFGKVQRTVGLIQR